MKPTYGRTKSERKKARSEAHSQYASVDLSYNKNVNINEVSILLTVKFLYFNNLKNKLFYN